MGSDEILAMRLRNQQISEHDFKNPQSLVGWMGAMQAQDYNSAKLAIKVRLADCDEKQIEEAFNNGEILRTHVLRPTWHFVTTENISWLLDLTAPIINASLKFRQKRLGITGEIISKSNSVITNALMKNDSQTKDELIDLLKQNSINFADKQTYYHLFLVAELNKLMISGQLKGKNHTYSLFDKRVSNIKALSKDDALAKLALIYFSTRGPATVYDFSWWSGLTVTDAKLAIHLSGSNLLCEMINDRSYYFSKKITPGNTKFDGKYFLPAFDEYLISYKDRSLLFSDDSKAKIISSNGIFRPIVVENGKVIGLWKKVLGVIETITIN